MATKLEVLADAKKSRLERIETIKTLAGAVNITLEASGSADMPAFVKKFNEFWPFLRECLAFARDLGITGPKTDKKLDDIMALGDKISKGKASVAERNEFIEKLTKVWKITRVVLEVIMLISKNPKVDAAIAKVISIVDWILGK